MDLLLLSARGSLYRDAYSCFDRNQRRNSHGLLHLIANEGQTPEYIEGRFNQRLVNIFTHATRDTLLNGA